MNLELNWMERAARCASRWNLSDLRWHPEVGTAHVGFCDSPHGPAVLKVSIESGMVEMEAKSLRHFGNLIAPKVLELDLDADCILLEKVEFDHDLSAWYPSPEREVAAWLSLFGEITAREEVAEGYPTLADYARVFDRVPTEELSTQLQHIFGKAREWRSILMANGSGNRLLHGDLHHFNLLHSPNGCWRMIDPHGVIGHPLYELGASLRNPWGKSHVFPGVTERLRDRIVILASRLQIAPYQVTQYGFYGAAFSVAWSLEEGSTDVQAMTVMANACLELMDEYSC